MINLPAFIIIFIAHFILMYYLYYTKANSLIVFHRNSLLVDMGAWIGGALVMYTAFLLVSLGYNNVWIVWLQLFAGMNLFNIHVARFIIRTCTSKGRRTA